MSINGGGRAIASNAYPDVAKAAPWREICAASIGNALGTAIAFDGHRPIVTPYDNCVLVQPSLRHLGPGNTVARLGRFVDPGSRAAG